MLDTNVVVDLCTHAIVCFLCYIFLWATTEPQCGCHLPVAAATNLLLS